MDPPSTFFDAEILSTDQALPSQPSPPPSPPYAGGDKLRFWWGGSVVAFFFRWAGCRVGGEERFVFMSVSVTVLNGLHASFCAIKEARLGRSL